MRGTLTIAYHDVGVVDVAHVAAARRAAGPEELEHVLAGDATWEGGDVPHRTVPGRRSSEARTHLGRHLDALLAFVRGRRRWRRTAQWRGVDLLDVARSAWFADVAEPVHRVFVVERLLAECPARLLWVTADAGLAASGFPDALQRAAAAQDVHADVVHVAAEGSAPRGARRPPGRFGEARRMLGAVRRDLSGGRACPSPDEAARRILVVEAFPNHLPAPVAVAEELRRRPGTQVVFAAANRAVLDELPPTVDPQALLALASRPARLARHLLTFAVDRTARQVSRAVAAGKGPAGLVGALAEPGFRQATAQAWRAAAEVTPACVDVVKRFRPTALVTSSKAPPAVRAALFASRPLGTTSWYVQHGSLYTAGKGDDHSIHDRFLVWGERERGRLVGGGIAPDRVAVTGSLKFAELGDRARTAPAGPRRDGRLTVAYLPSHSAGRIVSETNAAAMLRIVLDGVAAAGVGRLVIKVHPADRSSIFEHVDVDGRVEVEVLRGGDPIDVMLAASVVVASTSTAGVEACALGRPLVVLSLPGIPLPDEYERYGAAAIVGDADSLATVLRSLRDGDPHLTSRLATGRQALVDDLFAGMAPGTEVRCADAILAC